jgi:flagellar assembly protein FliH
MAGESRPFELRSFEEDVEALSRLARAREVLREAEEERDRMREEGRRAGFEAGLAEGREAAVRAERERVAAETAGLADALRRAAEGLETARAELAIEGERELLRLAVRIAERVVKAEVASGRPVAAANLRRAVELTARRREVRVRVHPADLSALEACLPDLRRSVTDLGAVAFDPDPSLARGGCVVTTSEGVADADVRAQLDEIERGLLG